MSMKRSILILFALLAVAFSACDRDDTSPQGCFEVKLVESYCTGDAVLQIVTPAAQAFGQTWTSQKDVTYEHVFRTTLPCAFDYDSFGNGETFSITLANTEDNMAACVRCAMAVGGLPEKFSHIRVAEGCGNTQE